MNFAITRTTKIKYTILAIFFVAIAAFGFAKINNQVNADNCPGTPPTTPAFNIWPLSFSSQNCKDLPLIDAKVLNGSGRDARYSASQSEHDAGISVAAGDQVRVSIYFHNGAAPANQNTATARNTAIGIATSVFGTEGTTHNLHGYISASNASTVSSTDANTGGDMTLRSATPTALAYVPGTTQMCIKYAAAVERKNAGQNVNLNQTCGTDLNGQPQVLIDLPDGIASGAVSIGDLPACFPYSGTLIFTASVIPATPPVSNGTIALTKTVRNVTTNESAFRKSTSAQKGDTVEFKITLNNTGNSLVQSVIIKDNLPGPQDFTMVPGSVLALNPNGQNTIFDDSLVNGAGISVTMVPGASASYTFKAIVNYPFEGTITNFASASGPTVNTAQDQASVTVSVPVITPPVDTSTTITVDKTVRNVSAGQTAFVKGVNAYTDDTVEFQMVFTNTGNNTAQIYFIDTMPSGLQFIDGSINYGNAYSVMFSAPGGSMLMASGVTYTITFKAKVLATGGTEVNRVNVTASNAPTVSSSAAVNIVARPVVTPTNTTISIGKSVRNVSANQTSFASSTTAKKDETVEFQIVVANTGNNVANNVNIRDVLPAGLSYLTGTIFSTNSVSGLNESLINGLGFTTNMAVGSSVNIKFKAIVNVNAGTLVNNVSAKGDNTNTISDSATVNVSTPPPVNNSLSITKRVRDITSGQTAYVKETNVSKNDVVQYQVVVTNTGNSTLTNLRITDALPNGLSYQANSFGINLTGNASTLDNVVVSSLAAGQSVTINFSAVATADCTSVVNTASAIATQIDSVSDTAKINVVCNPAPQDGTLTVTKLVKNLTQNSGTFVKQTTANAGDRLAYQITVTANGGKVTNVTLTDTLPTYFNFTSGSARLNLNNFSDSFTSSNVNIGSLNAGSTSTIYFEGTVNSSMPVGQTNMVNTASVSGDRLGTVSDSATVTVNVNGGGSGYAQLSINKLVRNTSGNGSSGFQDNTNAQANDNLSFQITVNNTGTTTLNNVYISDIMPAGLAFRPGSVRLDNSTGSDSIFNNRFSLGSMSAGQQHVITFDAYVGTSTSSTLINVAQAGADNYSQVQDSASVFVSQVAGSFVNITQSKRAYNNTKNIDATAVVADKGNVITYTLTIVNNGNAPATNYTISDDLSQVLNYSTMSDMEGGQLNGSVISWSGQTVPAYGTITKSFKVQVKNDLPAGSYTMVNTFGNTVTVNLQSPQVLGITYVAPKTGPTATYAFGFAALMTIAFAILKRKGYLSAVTAKIPRITIK